MRVFIYFECASNCVTAANTQSLCQPEEPQLQNSNDLPYCHKAARTTSLSALRGDHRLQIVIPFQTCRLILC